MVCVCVWEGICEHAYSKCCIAALEYEKVKEEKCVTLQVCVCAWNCLIYCTCMEVRCQWDVIVCVLRGIKSCILHCLAHTQTHSQRGAS